MPIPEPRPVAGSELTYETTLVGADPGMTYADLGARCGLRAAAGPAHLDPDLIPGARHRLAGWRGSLGQADIAAGHLRNQDVGPGDLFLFFGLFSLLGPRGFRGANRFHAIFGYLEVDRVVDLGAGEEPPDWASGHPHVSEAAHESFKPNVLYVARKQLTFAPGRPGWGVFRYEPQLRLTPANETKLTAWDLPGCLGPDAGTAVSYLPAHLWSTNGDRVRVEVVGNKQELVCTGGPEVRAWACDLVTRTATWAP